MRILPDGYTPLEYIQSSGTQYIDTGFKPKQNSKVVMDFQFLTKPTTHSAMFGVRNSNNAQFWCYYRYNSNGYSIRYATNSDVVLAYDATVRATVTMDANKLTVNGSTVTSTAGTFTSDYNMTLFADNNAGTIQYHGSFKMYSCQVYDNGTLIRNFVPCKNSSGEVGLYDLVNDVFYGNAGTGAFIAGPEFSYDEVEYIESTGTQYVNTNFKPSQNTEICMDFEITSLKNDYSAIFSARNTTSGEGSFSLWVNNSVPCFLWQYNTGNGKSTAKDAPPVLGTKIIAQNKANAMFINEFNLTEQATSFNTQYALYLLATNDPDPKNRYICNAKIYSCKIKENAVIVRDYIPVVGTDGVAGLWDKVERVFYGNAGTGAFVAGSIIPEEPDAPPVEIPEMPASIIAPYSDFANAVLIWSPVQGAETYNIQRDGVLVDTTEMPFYYDHDLAAETVYSYAVTACNVAGESEPATIVAETTTFKLITDRTADDVQAVLTAISTGVLPNKWLAGMKGAYNATDFNRVEAAVLFVLKRLEVAGWYLSVQTKTDWTFVDFPNQAEMQRYLDNIRLLRAALPTNILAVPDTMRLLKYEDANRIEQILEMLDATVTNIMMNVYYTNEIYSGEV